MEKLNGLDSAGASVQRGAGAMEMMKKVKGIYAVTCIGKDGKEKWSDTIDNLVTDVGANELLDAGVSTTSYLGLISSVGYSTTAVGDTMASHAGWNEAGNGVNFPNWSTPASNARVNAAFDAAAARAKAISAAASFTIATNGGTVKGCFIVLGTGAVATNNDTNGVLLSAGVFTGGDKIVDVGDTLQVSYSISL